MPKMLCPQCGVGINVPDRYAGKRVRCPKCQAECLVPDFFEEQLGGPSEGPAEQEPFEPPSPFARPSSTPEFPQDTGPPEQEVFEAASTFERQPKSRARKNLLPEDDRPQSGLGLASMVAGISGAIVFGLTLQLAIAAGPDPSAASRAIITGQYRVGPSEGDARLITDGTLTGILFGVVGLGLGISALMQRDRSHRATKWGLWLNGTQIALLSVLMFGLLGIFMLLCIAAVVSFIVRSSKQPP